VVPLPAVSGCSAMFGQIGMPTSAAMCDCTQTRRVSFASRGSANQMRQRGKHATFVVSAVIGQFVGTPWPFGRLEVSDDAVSGRTMFRERTCPRCEISEISLAWFGPNKQLVFDDPAGKMADVTVFLAMRVQGVVGELRRRGYPVVDRRGSLLGGKVGVTIAATTPPSNSTSQRHPRSRSNTGNRPRSERETVAASQPEVGPTFRDDRWGHIT
jgi:hypothetical protein